MKKLSLVTALLLFFAPMVFAETSNPAPVETATADDQEINTSPITDIDPLTENEAVAVDSYQVIPKTAHDENVQYHYTIDVTYPQITGDNLSPAAQQFNQTMSNMVNDEMEKFKNNVKLDSAHMNTLPEEVRNNSFKLDYDIDVVKPEAKQSLISVRLSIEGMQAGRPHPFHSHQVLNYDLTNGKTLALNDLFKKNTKYLAAIAKISNQKLNETLKDKWLIADGTKADPNNYKNWNLQDDSVLITFEEYQVAPYVYGPQEVEIPLAELTKMIAANAPVLAEYKQPDTITATPKAIAKSKDNKKVAEVKTNKKSKTV